MAHYVSFLVIGLILGLFTEFELKLVAGIKPEHFPITLVAYPVLISIGYAASQILDRTISSRWTSDLIYFFGAGVFGLMIEWTLLGNAPGSNAIQLGMFAMWTTYFFGPRTLTRKIESIKKSRQRFFIAFAIAAALLILVVLISSNPKAKIVLAVLGLTATYIVWMIWLLKIAWQTRKEQIAITQ